jgi:hypothetical protein
VRIRPVEASGFARLRSVSATQYYTATSLGALLLPHLLELRLDELGRNDDFAAAKFSVVRPER